MGGVEDQVTLKLSLELEYQAKPEYYGTSDPKAMGSMDLENWFDIVAGELEIRGEQNITVSIDAV